MDIVSIMIILLMGTGLYTLFQRVSRLEDQLSKLERGFDHRFAVDPIDPVSSPQDVAGDDDPILDPIITQTDNMIPVVDAVVNPGVAPVIAPVAAAAEQRFVPAKIVKAPVLEGQESQFKSAVIAGQMPQKEDATPKETPKQSTGHSPESPQRASQKRNISINFEELFGKKLPIWAGGITLAVAGFLMVKYAIDMGFFGRIFTPVFQVISALLFGGGLIASAEWAHKAKDKVDDPRVSQALSGAGIATLYGAFLAAGNGYGLIEPLIAFIGMAAVTAGALFLATRHGMPSALLGLAGGLAAPALVGGVSVNAPLLAVYLSLTIAGLSGVSRKQRWPWLAIAALLGGAGWSMWMIFASDALDKLATLSVGGFVVLLAIAIPMFALDGPRAALMRTASAAVGAVQLAVLVALGGFAPLNWGFFILLAAAGQWIAWRDKGLHLVPTIGLGVSVVLLLIWPSPDPMMLLGVGVLLAVIHAVPLLLKLWDHDAALQRSSELIGLALAAPAVAAWHFMDASNRDMIVSLVSATAFVLPAFALFKGWAVEARKTDNRFVVLTAGAALLAFLAVASPLPAWAGGIVMAGAALTVLYFAFASEDQKVGRLAAILVVSSLAPFVSSLWQYSVELTSLSNGAQGTMIWTSAFRWLALCITFGIFAWKRTQKIERAGFQSASAFFAYGVLAMMLPFSMLPLIPVVVGVGLVLVSRRLLWPALMPALCVMLGLSAAWAALPLTDWGMQAAASLVGFPQDFSIGQVDWTVILKQLLAPAAAIGFALYTFRNDLPKPLSLALGGVAALLASMAIHSLYRLSFTMVAGDDFVATGIVQRLIWSMAFVGIGALLWRFAKGHVQTYLAPAIVGVGALHHSYFSLFLHNPIWAEQSVGNWPVVNWILPLFIVLPASLYLLKKMQPDIVTRFARSIEIVHMISIALFTWATLRQAFHGSLLTQDGVYPSEDILRSLIGIALGIGFLLWGIKAQKRDWRLGSLAFMLIATLKVFLLDASGLEGLLRIGSFIALGFSLIGIGWLYTRQLKRDDMHNGRTVEQS